MDIIGKPIQNIISNIPGVANLISRPTPMQTSTTSRPTTKNILSYIPGAELIARPIKGIMSKLPDTSKITNPVKNIISKFPGGNLVNQVAEGIFG